MKQTSGPTKKAPAEAVLMDIRRATKRQFSAEEKIRCQSARDRDPGSASKRDPGGSAARWV